MNYFVCLKQVPDTTTRFQLKEGEKEVDLSAVKWVINPYDEFALEEAIQWSEKDSGKVEVCAVGPAQTKEALRTALAMGAHSGVHVHTEQSLDSLQTAQVIFDSLSEKLKKTDVIFCGRSAVDWNFGAFGGALAQLLNRTYISLAVKIEKKENSLEILRSVEGGLVEILEVTGPVVISVTKGINTPRYPSLPGIMKAKNKPIETLSAPSFEPHFTVEHLSFPKPRPSVQMIEGTADEQAQKLVRLLKEKEQVL
ncbi:MAG: electron transfer flavoprotein subunit beta/FixA family protein [Bdellovibrionales bacterium]|nr:electron transfer flavoprotein subunit beta/FixA family protein [Bdellovibrionales bacterium]